MDEIEVEARFSATGQITVLRFVWGGRTWPVAGPGRQWNAADGVHCLVMTTGEQIFELVYVPERGLWRVAQAPLSERLA